MADGKLSASGDWAVLQQKIFTRWVNQKIAVRKIKIDSVVTGFADGVALAALIEVMSEKKLPGKPLVPQTMRVKQIDNNKQVLDFILKDCGVKTEVPPSAENLADHTEKPIMGLIWGIMTRFLKFSDDDEQQMSAEDALLMWVNNQVNSYGLHAKDFTKAFHDGKIYAALIHKNRNRLISVDDMNGSNEENIAKVFAAANKYFGFEAYLEPSDIAKLDSKSGFVFTSEFYYGIAAQRKKDLAARRIAKVIDYTKVNDKLRADYKALGEKLKAHLDKVNATLNDKTIDNTLAGAKAKLEEYYAFKKSDKGVIVGDFLKLESLLANLAMRLADGKRPEFKAADGQAVSDFKTGLIALDALEAQRGIELIAELNRQNRLVKVNSQHEARFSKIKAWVVAKEAYLNTKEQVDSSGAAEYQLNRLASYDDEAAAIQATLVVELTRLGAELVTEKYEHSDAVTKREGEVKDDSARLEGLSAQKNNVLTDDLARMKYKESIHLVALKHSAKFDQLKAWVEEKRGYLNKVESINSVNEAQLALSVLDSYEADKKDLEATPVPALKALGAEILSAEYKSDLSSWKFENPQQIQGPEAELDAALATELTGLSAKKRAALEEDLKREIEKERLRLLFATQAGSLIRWTKSVGEDLDGVVNFGLDLDEVSAAKAGIDAEDKKNTDNATARAGVAKETLAQGAKLGVTENPYTTHTSAEIDESVAALSTAQAGRQTRYAAELERVTEDDNLCKQLAGIANPLVESIEKNKAAVNENKGELEDQAKTVEDLLAVNLGAAEAKQALELQAQIEARGVTKNKHTNYSGNDVSIRVEQYGAFLASKKDQITDQIKIKNSRGITPEQMAEIELQFAQFDKNSNKVLDLNEFKACLYSLGEEKSKADVVALMEQYGDGKTIPHSGFKAFMVKLLGDANTQPEIVEGFKLLADDNEKVNEKQLNDVFPDLEDVAYLKANAPADGDLLDYTAWTESVFSR